MNRITATLFAHAVMARAEATEAEKRAYAELTDLARKWREQNTAERVLNSLQDLRERPFI